MNQILPAAADLVIGQRVYCILYGGRFGTIVEIQGEQSAGSCRVLGGGVGVMGGSARVDIVWDDGSKSGMLPESLVRGSVQWKRFDEVVSAEQVAERIAAAAVYAAQQKAKADAERAAFERAKEAAKAEGLALGLIPEAEFRAAGKRGTAAAYNLRLELKAAGIKARVNGDYSSVNVYVADPAQIDAANEIGRKYKAGSFDGMTDCYDYDPCAWGSVFGDVQYVFVQKEWKQ
jgi:hypothetical protein